MKAKFHFFGKDCLIDRALQNRAEIEASLQKQNIFATNILMTNQVHGTEVVTIDTQEKIYTKQNLPKADALVTNLPNIALGLFTADCSPILFFDEENKIIGAAHAGWRGAKSGIIANTVLAMKKLGAKNIQAKIGPMIQQESYEVSLEFLDDFLIETPENKKFFLDCKNPQKYLFDLSKYIESKLQIAGISKIDNCHIDTYKNAKEFFSFRRSTHLKEVDCGRNISVIAINGNV